MTIMMMMADMPNIDSPLANTTDNELYRNSTTVDGMITTGTPTSSPVAVTYFDENLIDLMLPGSLRTTATVLCLIILVLGVCGNLLVPLVVCRTKDLCANNSTNVFLINLSVADLLVLVVCMPTVLIELHSRPEVWMLGEFMCKAVPFVELVVAHGSILTILAISFERYYAICKPLKANYKCTNRRAVITICGLWTLALAATIPVLFGTELVEAMYIDGSVVSACITKANATWQRLYFLVSIVAFFCLPLLILIVVYCIITRRLIRDDRRLLIASIHSSFTTTISGSSNQICQSNTSLDHKESSRPSWPTFFRSSTGSRSGSACGGPPPGTGNQPYRRNSSVVAAAAVARSRRQVIFMLAAVVICFFICLLPFRLFTLWLLLVTEDDIRALSMEKFYNLLYFCRIMIYVNSMLNPLLYAAVSSKFRRALMDTVMKIFRFHCYCYCGCCDFCVCTTDDPESPAVGLHVRKQRFRTPGAFLKNRRQLFLVRQSTTLTTGTTTTTTSSSSLKNNSSIRSHTTNMGTPMRYSSLDSVRGAKSAMKMQSSLDSTSGSEPLPSLGTADETPIRLNGIYSSQHTAEYRRKAMMKRSSRVAIIDEDCEECIRSLSPLNLGGPTMVETRTDTGTPPPKMVPRGSSPTSTSSSATPSARSSYSSSSSMDRPGNNERPEVNDSTFSTYESYV